MLTSSPVLGAVLVLTRRASLCSTSILDPGRSGLPVPGVLSSSRGASASTDPRSRFLARCVCVAPFPNAAAAPPTPLFFASLAHSTCADALCLSSLDSCAALQAALVDLSDPLSAFLTMRASCRATRHQNEAFRAPLSAHEPRRPHSLCNLCWEGRSRPLPCLQSASSADAPQEQSPAMMEYHRASLTLVASLSSPLCTTLRRCGRGIQHTLLESILTHMCCLRLHPLRGTTLFLSKVHKRFPPSSFSSPLICRLCHLLQCSSWKSPALRIVEAS